jgi:hypothetical protein
LVQIWGKLTHFSPWLEPGWRSDIRYKAKLVFTSFINCLRTVIFSLIGLKSLLQNTVYNCVTTVCSKASLIPVSGPALQMLYYIYCINLNALADEKVEKIKDYVIIIET